MYSVFFQNNLKSGPLGSIKMIEINHAEIAGLSDPADRELMWDLLGSGHSGSLQFYFDRHDLVYTPVI